MTIEFSKEEGFTAVETRFDCLCTLISSHRWPDDTLEELTRKADAIMEWLHEKSAKTQLKVIKK